MKPKSENWKISAIFTDIADLLEEQGENPYKVRAYRNAVHTIEELPEPLSAVAAHGELAQLPGFGDRMVKVTNEILQTGTCALYEQLKAEHAGRDRAAEDEDTLDFEDAMVEDEADVPAPW